MNIKCRVLLDPQNIQCCTVAGRNLPVVRSRTSLGRYKRKTQLVQAKAHARFVLCDRPFGQRRRPVAKLHRLAQATERTTYPARLEVGTPPWINAF